MVQSRSNFLTNFIVMTEIRNLVDVVANCCSGNCNVYDRSRHLILPDLTYCCHHITDFSCTLLILILYRHWSNFLQSERRNRRRRGTIKKLYCAPINDSACQRIFFCKFPFWTLCHLALQKYFDVRKPLCFPTSHKITTRLSLQEHIIFSQFSNFLSVSLRAPSRFYQYH